MIENTAQWRKQCLISLLVTLASGCTSVEEVMKTNRDMTDVIGMNYAGMEVIRDRIGRQASPDLAGYTRTAANENEVLFPELPNPKLVMFVHPHITEENTPIPGYSIPIYLFEGPVYAQPGEAWGWE